MTDPQTSSIIYSHVAHNRHAAMKEKNTHGKSIKRSPAKCFNSVVFVRIPMNYVSMKLYLAHEIAQKTSITAVCVENGASNDWRHPPTRHRMGFKFVHTKNRIRTESWYVDRDARARITHSDLHI